MSAGSGSRLAGLVLATALAIAACGLPEDAAPRAVDDLPDDLFATTTATEVPVEGTGRTTVTLFWYDDAQNLPIRVERRVETEPTYQTVLDILGDQPNEADLAEAKTLISTKLPPEMDPRAGEVTAENALLVLDGGAALRQLSADPDRVYRVYVQLVCSLTAFDEDLTGVQIIDNQGMVLVALPDGVQIDSRPVTPTDVGGCRSAEELLAPEETTTTR